MDFDCEIITKEDGAFRPKIQTAEHGETRKIRCAWSQRSNLLFHTPAS
jgi:hypothetical protein